LISKKKNHKISTKNFIHYCKSRVQSFQCILSILFGGLYVSFRKLLLNIICRGTYVSFRKVIIIYIIFFLTSRGTFVSFRKLYISYISFFLVCLIHCRLWKPSLAFSSYMSYVGYIWWYRYYSNGKLCICTWYHAVKEVFKKKRYEQRSMRKKSMRKK